MLHQYGFELAVGWFVGGLVGFRVGRAVAGPLEGELVLDTGGARTMPGLPAGLDGDDVAAGRVKKKVGGFVKKVGRLVGATGSLLEPSRGILVGGDEGRLVGCFPVGCFVGCLVGGFVGGLMG